MAEYYAVLKKAVGSLDGNAADTRRAVYDKARNALIGQLKAVDPPLTTAEISRQRLELEEAIRKVEREAASSPSSPPAARPSNPPVAIALPRAEPPPPPPPPPQPSAEMPPDGGPTPQDVFRRAIQEAEQRGNAAGAIDRAPPPAYRPEYSSAAATAADLRPRNLPVRDELPPPRRPEPPYQPPAKYEPPRPANEPRLAPDYNPDWDQQAPAPGPAASIQPSPFLDSRDRPVLTKRKRGYLEDDDRKLYERAATARKSRLPAILLTVLILAVLGGIGALGWANRDKLSDLMKSFTSGSSVTAAKPAAPVVADTSNKNADRLPDAGAPPAPTTDVRVVTPAPAAAPVEPASTVPPAATDQTAAPAADAADAADTVTDVPPPAPIAEAPPAPAPAATPAPATGDALVAQKAILYEEPVDAAAAASGVVAINAAVTWRFVETGPNGPEIEASLQVPERNMKVRLTIHKNSDTSLPASHLIEVVIDTPPDFPGKGIKSVPRLVMKPTEEARGQPLVGAPAKVTDGFFWIALSSAQEDVDANLALMRERNWIDLPFVYDTGQRAILTFEKGTPGERVFEKAAAAWSGQG